jgi:hypothetical protein
VLRAAAQVEKLGIPTASIIGSGFLKQAEVVKKGLGVPLAIGVYPGAPMVDSLETLQQKVEESLAPGLLKGLIGHAPIAAASVVEPVPGAVAFSGSYDEVQEYFHDKLWTDGLPIVPPTRNRVDEFLKFTDRAPEDVIGVLPSEGREASILSIAVNAVMSGCRPEYMPILIPIVESMAEHRFHLRDVGSTPGWEPVVIVSGPIANELDFNSGQGMMRVGRQANTSVGRFVRMYLRNVCGFRIPPGAGDKGSIGQSFLVAMAEDEGAAVDVGWPTFSEDQGFQRGDNVVTVQSVVAITSPMYSAGDKAVVHLQQWAEIMAGTFTYWSHAGLKKGLWGPLIVASPSVARVIAREYTKDEARRYLKANMRATAERLTHYARQTSTPTFTFEAVVAEGTLPEEYIESTDPQRLVDIVVRADEIRILVAGDPGRNQSRAYMSNHIQAPPISKRVVLPEAWEALRAAQKKRKN